MKSIKYFKRMLLYKTLASKNEIDLTKIENPLYATTCNNKVFSLVWSLQIYVDHMGEMWWDVAVIVMQLRGILHAHTNYCECKKEVQ